VSLKTRILALLAALIVIAATASLLAYRELSASIIERWGKQVAEIQVRYDSARLLQSLEREIGLARQMAQSGTLLRWANNPETTTPTTSSATPSIRQNLTTPGFSSSSTRAATST